MLTVKVEGIEELTRGLNDLAMTQVPFAKVTALTWTGYSAKKRLYAQMRAKFDRPSPFVVPPESFDRQDNIGSMRVEWATPAKPYAVVKMKDYTTAKQRVATDPLLRHHFFGGSRVAKGVELWFREKGLLGAGEFLVLGKNLTRDRYGNMGMAMWNKMVSQLGLTGGSRGYNRDASNQRGSRKSKAVTGTIWWSTGKRGGKLIDVETGIQYGVSGRQNNLPKGVWIRNGAEMHALMVVVDKAPSYKQRFDLQAIAAEAVREDFATNFKSALKKAVANSGFKGKWRS